MKQKWESRYCSFWVNSPCYIYYIIKGRIFDNFMRLLITSEPKQKKKPLVDIFSPHMERKNVPKSI